MGLGLSLKIYSLSLGLDIETGIEKVLVSVSTLRPWFPKSQSRSRDSNLSIANPCHSVLLSMFSEEEFAILDSKKISIMDECSQT
jgi:hypothetical protein